jgi:phosphoglycolate phosphatase/HAD superfamily phosphatase
LGIKELFDDVFADDGAHPPKPDPYYAEKFMQKYGLDRSETLMVGDTFTDVNFAKNSKISFVGLAKNQRNRQLLEERGATVISEMKELLGVLGYEF